VISQKCPLSHKATRRRESEIKNEIKINESRGARRTRAREISVDRSVSKSHSLGCLPLSLIDGSSMSFLCWCSLTVLHMLYIFTENLLFFMFHGARCSSLVFPLLQLSRAARNSEFIELRKCVNYSIATVAAELHSIFARPFVR
jgi:hypothetical protein